MKICLMRMKWKEPAYFSNKTDYELWLTSEKNSIFYRTEMERLKSHNEFLIAENKAIKGLNKQLKIKMVKIANLKFTTNSRMRQLKRKQQTLIQQIDNSSASNHSKTFAKMLIKQKTSYTNDEKDLTTD